MRRLRAGVPLLLVLLFAYLPLVFGQILFQRDVGRLQYPGHAFVQAALHEGRWPFWNPWQGLGASGFADPQLGLFYPPNLVFAVGAPELTLSWFLWGHMLLGALGVHALVRRFGGGLVPALVAALGWSLCGVTTSEFAAGYRLITMAWMPFCALGFMHLAAACTDSNRALARGVAWAAAPVAAALLSGEPFVAMLDAGFGLVVAVVFAARAPGASARIGRRFALGAAAACVVASLIGAAAVLPSARATAQGSRAERLPLLHAERLSFHPMRLVELVAPGAMGDPYSTDYPGGPIVGEPSTGDRPLLYGVYLGASLVALALCAFGRGRRTAAALGGLALFALAIAFGRHLPVHRIFRLVVFPLAFMRAPEKYLLWVLGFVVLLAGLGARRLSEDGPRPWRRIAALAATLSALAVAAPLVFPIGVGGYVRQGAHWGALATAGVLAVVLLSGRRRIALLALPACVALDLLPGVWSLQSFAPPPILSSRPLAADVIAADARAAGESAPPRVYRAPEVDETIGRFAPPATAIGVQRNLLATLIDNTSAVAGVAAVPGYSAATPVPLTTLTSAFKRAGLDVLRVLGVAYVVMPADPRATADPLVDAGLRPLLDPVPGARLYRVGGVLPRVYLAGDGVEMGDDEAIGRWLTPEVVAGGRAWIAPGSGVKPPGGAATRAGVCALTSYTLTELEAVCHAERPAVAVFVEQFAAGWRATVDGAATPVMRANIVGRGVVVPTGEHHIRMSFSPPGLGLGCGVSLAGLAALAALFALGRRAP